MRRAAILSLALLAACEMPPPAPITASTSGSSQVPPIGTRPAVLPDVVDLYVAACVNTAPSFAGADAVARAEGMAQNADTGTYYHPTLDLSIQADEECSMVFSSREDPGQLALSFSFAVSTAQDGDITVGLASDLSGSIAGGPGGTRFEFQAVGTNNGAPFYRAILWPR